MTRVWFQLVSSSGAAYKDSDASKVSLPSATDVDDFRDAVKAKYADSHLMGVAPSDLKVYKNKEAFEKRNDDDGKQAPLDPTESLDGLGNSKDMLVVVVPSPSRQMIEVVTRSPRLPEEIPSVDPLSRFWQALKLSQTPLDGSHKVISLTEDVFLLGCSDLGSSIFVRECYPRLLEITLSIIHRQWTRRLAILGNPGIGKTFFGYYLLAHLARLPDVTVVYQVGTDRFLLSTNLIAAGSEHDFKEQLRSKDTFYIVDGIAPNEAARAKTVLLSSPRKDIWHRFCKTSATMRYMPVWTLEELQQCRELLYSSKSIAFPENAPVAGLPHIVPKELVDSLFGKWGGIPRYVLQYALDDVQQGLLEAALCHGNLDEVVASYGDEGPHIEVSNRLLHLVADENFKTISYRFASDYVAGQVFSRLLKEKRDALITFMSASKGVGDIGTMRGTLFERFSHMVLGKKGKFKVRRLVDASHSEKRPRFDSFDFALDPVSSLVFNGNQGEEILDNVYYRPRSRNFQSVDSFMKPDMMFQITTADRHPCKEAGITKVLTLLGSPKTPKLYFVVPTDQFEDFKFQKLITKGNESVSELVQQFVLTFDLTSDSCLSIVSAPSFQRSAEGSQCA